MAGPKTPNAYLDKRPAGSLHLHQPPVVQAFHADHSQTALQKSVWNLLAPLPHCCMVGILRRVVGVKSCGLLPQL